MVFTRQIWVAAAVACSAGCLALATVCLAFGEADARVEITFKTILGMKMAAEFIFSVDAHISLMHSSGKPYEFDQCKHFSKTAQNLNTQKLTHSGEKPYAWDQCKCSSKTAQNLITHKLTHSGEKPYACDQCKYSSKMSQNPKTHKLKHSGEYPYASD